MNDGTAVINFGAAQRHVAQRHADARETFRDHPGGGYIDYGNWWPEHGETAMQRFLTVAWHRRWQIVKSIEVEARDPLFADAINLARLFCPRSPRPEETPQPPRPEGHTVGLVERYQNNNGDEACSFYRFTFYRREAAAECAKHGLLPRFAAPLAGIGEAYVALLDVARTLDDNAIHAVADALTVKIKAARLQYEDELLPAIEVAEVAEAAERARKQGERESKRTADTGDAPEPAAVVWSKPDSPKNWCRLFGFSLTTFKRRINNGKLRVIFLHSKCYRIDVQDLPPDYLDQQTPATSLHKSATSQHI